MPKWLSLGESIGKDVGKTQSIVSFDLVVMKNILKTVVLNRRGLPPGTFGNVGRHFGCHN